MTKRQVHIVGAGMAGLSAALQLTLAGEKVVLYEGAPFAGGRCRSFVDRELGCRIDNGNHLIFSGNAAIHDYLALTNAFDTVGGPGKPLFPFMDLETSARWTVHMNKSIVPWWIFSEHRRIPGTTPKDYLAGLSLLTADATDRVAERFDTKSLLYRRFWEPLTIGALNTEPELASAELLANVFKQSFCAGGDACIPMIPKVGLSETFVQPCLDMLQKLGLEIRYTHRLRSLRIDALHIRELDFNSNQVAVQPHDWVILALPAWVVHELLPEIRVPTEYRSIISAHYKVEGIKDANGFCGLINSLAEWVFVRGDVISTTLSCAERYGEYPVRDMAYYLWQNVAKVYDLDPQSVPQHRIFKEKCATFAATPEQNMRRPTAYTGWKNLALGGEWTATGLPSTIEGAIRSGVKAAQVVMRWA